MAMSVPRTSFQHMLKDGAKVRYDNVKQSENKWHLQMFQFKLKHSVFTFYFNSNLPLLCPRGIVAIVL